MSEYDFTRHGSSARNLAARIALAGGKKRDGAWEAPWVPACSNPPEIEYYNRVPHGLDGSRSRPYTVRMLVPCRKCDRCLQIRQMQWSERIRSESYRHTYNYFVTLTFSPAHLAGVLALARSRDHADIERAAYTHVSKYFKRLRHGRKKTHRKGLTDNMGRVRQKFDPIDLRFFACSEYGEENGRLHFHAIVHTERYVPPTVFKTEWRSRSDAEMVRSRDGAAIYVSKYLTKDQRNGRARASLAYGALAPPPSAPRTDALGLRTWQPAAAPTHEEHPSF